MGPFHPISQIKHSHWDSIILIQSVEPQIYSTVRFLFYFCVCKGRCRRSRLKTLLLNESSKFDHFMAYWMQCFPHFMSPFNTQRVWCLPVCILFHTISYYFHIDNWMHWQHTKQLQHNEEKCEFRFLVISPKQMNNSPQCQKYTVNLFITMVTTSIYRKGFSTRLSSTLWYEAC